MTHGRIALMLRAIGTLQLLLLTAGGAAQADAVEPLRLTATIEGRRAVIEVRDQSRQAAQQSIREAFEVIAATLRSLDADSPDSDLSRLNTSAGQGPQLIDQDLFNLLQKTIGFCVWSRRAQGPLGGPLYRLWRSSNVPPTHQALQTPVQATSCENLQLRPDTLQASLASDCRLDLHQFADGFAVDRATERLVDLGASNLWVELGSIVRALGAGADGRGWRFTLPLFAGMSEGLGAIRLTDVSLAVVSAHRDRFRFGELSYAPFLDQRTGQPASGVVAALVATPRASDAQALATTMLILGNREGPLRLANVTPTPSALWLLGDGTGEPLLSTYKWTSLGSP